MTRYSRRNVLHAVGIAGTVALTGCLDGLVRSTSDSRTLSISGTESGHTASDFRSYVNRIDDRYGPHGVWGVRNATNNPPTERLTFAGAWSDQWVLGSASDGAGKGIHAPIDVVGVLYRIQSSGGQAQRYRLWLWTATTPTQPDDGAGNTNLTTLSIGVNLTGGVLHSYSPNTSVGPDDAPVKVGLTNPPHPQAQQRLPAGRIQPDSEETNTGKNGSFTLNWSGGYGNTISVAGVCELRQLKKEYELTVTSEASASQGTL